MEVIGHAALATRAIGWESGFHYYMLIFIPLIFASSTRRLGQKVVMMTLICAIYILLDSFLKSVVPLTAVDPLVLSLIRYTNVTISFAFLGYVAYLYIKTVDKAEDMLFTHATTDPLTNLYNRRYLLDVIEYERRQVQRSNKPFSIIMADLDDFKTINDIYGHNGGDQILVNISNLLMRVLREQDIASRWGGEEFLILLPNTDLSEATMIAERIKETVNSTKTNYMGNEIEVNFTMGVSEYRLGEPSDTCISRADNAMYRGKSDGKNRIKVAA